MKDELITTENVRPMQSAAHGNGQEDQKGNKAMKEAMTIASQMRVKTMGKDAFALQFVYRS